MSKLSEFYKQAMGEEETKKKIEKILAGKEISDATDEQLEKVGELAKGLGYEFTLEDVKGYLKGEEVALDEEDLEAVAGGKGVYVSYKNCQTGYDSGDIKISPFV